MLDREGAQFVSAENGAQALERLRAPGEAFDAVLMDVQMPVMDGLATTRLIREKLGLDRLPVIAVSAGVLDDQRQQVFEAGANDFLPKPIDLEELVATLCRWTREIAIASAAIPRSTKTVESPCAQREGSEPQA
jgi:CheY-like chemotaxis protein